MKPIEVFPLSAERFELYGWMLGKGIKRDGGVPAFTSGNIDFCEEHIFDPGAEGETEVLWVDYRNRHRAVSRLEVHRLTEQAIIPLTGEIIQIVAGSLQDGSLEENSVSAFRVPVGQGICMRPGCWHATRVDAPEVQCVMLTRRSTTVDLIAFLNSGFSLSESAIAVVERTF